MSEPLKEPRLRVGKKRRVITVTNAAGQMPTFVDKSGKVGSGFIAITRAIANGDALPDDFYRKHNGRSDTLLMTLGIMHLHLYEGSKELLFLMQFEDHVIFIELNDHAPFYYDPNAIAYFRLEYMQAIHLLEQRYQKELRDRQKAVGDAIARLKKASRPESD